MEFFFSPSEYDSIQMTMFYTDQPFSVDTAEVHLHGEDYFRINCQACQMLRAKKVGKTVFCR